MPLAELDRERQIDDLEFQWKELDRLAAILPLSGMQAAMRKRFYAMWKSLREARYDVE